MEFESLATHISDVDQICYGMKVAVCDILIRRGILLLKPSNFEVLGGAVERTQGSTNGVIDLSQLLVMGTMMSVEFPINPNNAFLRTSWQSWRVLTYLSIGWTCLTKRDECDMGRVRDSFCTLAHHICMPDQVILSSR